MTTVIDCLPAAAKPAPDLKAVKNKQHAAWSSGDYALIGVTLQIVGEQLAEALDLRAGQKVLDIAAGNGNVTLAAARRWCDVTSTDYVELLLARGRKRAEADGLKSTSALPTPSNCRSRTDRSTPSSPPSAPCSAPTRTRTASEMLRVCRSGGKIGLANWTPGGFIGQMFKMIGKYLPPPAGVKSPALWGTSEWMEKAFRAECDEHRHRAASVQLPLPLAAALPRHLPRLLRADAEGLRCARCRRPERARARSPGADRRIEYGEATAPWWCRANTSKSSSPSGER